MKKTAIIDPAKVVAMKLMVLLLFPLMSFAHTSYLLSDGYQMSDSHDPLGYWGFIASELGYSDYDHALQAHEGNLLALSGGVSRYSMSRRWVSTAQLGLKRVYQYGKDVDVALGFVEFSQNFRMSPRWHAGPVLHVLLGDGREMGSSDDTFTGFVGANVFRDFSWNQSLVKLGGKVITDFTIPESTATQVFLEVQISFGAVNASQRVTTSKPKEVVDPHYVKRFSVPTKLFFKLNESEPLDQSKEALIQLAEILKKNQGKFTRLEIQGFTDKTGSDSFNKDLSQQRADRVADFLKTYGVPASKIESRGMGTDMTEYSGKNFGSRRVEFRLKDVTKKDWVESL